MSRMISPVGNILTSALPVFTGTKGKQRLTILIYHRVIPEPDPVYAGGLVAKEFEWQMELLSKYFNPISLEQALNSLESGTLPERAVCVTFDDGYSDNEQVALPILKRWSVPATVFVATDFLNGGMMWNDVIYESIRIFDGNVLDLNHFGLGTFELKDNAGKRKAAASLVAKIKHWEGNLRSEATQGIKSLVGDLRTDMMMTDEQVRNLSKHGVEIGAHTTSHPILAKINMSQAVDEIEGSRFYLENILQDTVRYFAYPNGKVGEDYFPQHRDLVKDIGFSAALSTHWGAVSMSSDVWQLPRFTPWDRTPMRFLCRLLLNYRNPA